jgi:hypothetical protein
MLFFKVFSGLFFIFYSGLLHLPAFDSIGTATPIMGYTTFIDSAIGKGS